MDLRLLGTMGLWMWSQQNIEWSEEGQCHSLLFGCPDVGVYWKSEGFEGSLRTSIPRSTTAATRCELLDHATELSVFLQLCFGAENWL